MTVFYCDPCGAARGWPTDVILSQSYGPCESCRKTRVCNDVPSSLLPMPSNQGGEAAREAPTKGSSDG